MHYVELVQPAVFCQIGQKSVDYHRSAWYDGSRCVSATYILHKCSQCMDTGFPTLGCRFFFFQRVRNFAYTDGEK